MKVICIVVIFFVIWRWSCAHPCTDHSCAHNHIKNISTVHACKNAISTNIIDYQRPARSPNFQNFTDSIKRGFRLLGQKLHIFKRQAADINNPTEETKINGTTTEQPANNDGKDLLQHTHRGTTIDDNSTSSKENRPPAAKPISETGSTLNETHAIVNQVTPNNSGQIIFENTTGSETILNQSKDIDPNETSVFSKLNLSHALGNITLNTINVSTTVVPRQLILDSKLNLKPTPENTTTLETDLLHNGQNTSKNETTFEQNTFFPEINSGSTSEDNTTLKVVAENNTNPWLLSETTSVSSKEDTQESNKTFNSENITIIKDNTDKENMNIPESRQSSKSIEADTSLPSKQVLSDSEVNPKPTLENITNIKSDKETVAKENMYHPLESRQLLQSVNFDGTSLTDEEIQAILDKLTFPKQDVTILKNYKKPSQKVMKRSIGYNVKQNKDDNTLAKIHPINEYVLARKDTSIISKLNANKILIDSILNSLSDKASFLKTHLRAYLNFSDKKTVTKFKRDTTEVLKNVKTQKASDGIHYTSDSFQATGDTLAGIHMKEVENNRIVQKNVVGKTGIRLETGVKEHLKEPTTDFTTASESKQLRRFAVSGGKLQGLQGYYRGKIKSRSLLKDLSDSNKNKNNILNAVAKSVSIKDVKKRSLDLDNNIIVPFRQVDKDVVLETSTTDAEYLKYSIGYNLMDAQDEKHQPFVGETVREVELIGCTCAIYLPTQSNKETKPFISESVLEIASGLDATSKKLICARACSETSQMYFSIKQEVCCTHIQRNQRELTDDSLAQKPNFLEKDEIIFCQVDSGEVEPTLRYILSWLNVVILDVVVCLTGLGIVCIYLICFISWRKRATIPNVATSGKK